MKAFRVVVAVMVFALMVMRDWGGWVDLVAWKKGGGRGDGREGGRESGREGGRGDVGGY